MERAANLLNSVGKPVLLGVIGSLVATLLLAGYAAYSPSINKTWFGVGLVLLTLGISLALSLTFAKRDAIRQASFADVSCDLLTRCRTLRRANDATRPKEYAEEHLGGALDLVCSATDLPQINAALLYLRDPSQPDWLEACARSKDKGVSRKRFYIGDGEYPPGAASVAFKENRPIIVRFDRKQKPDYPLFQQFKRQPTSTYRSFVVCPVAWGQEVLGVVSFESRSRYGIRQQETHMYQLLALCLASCVHRLQGPGLIDLNRSPPAMRAEQTNGASKPSAQDQV